MPLKLCHITPFPGYQFPFPCVQYLGMDLYGEWHGNKHKGSRLDLGPYYITRPEPWCLWLKCKMMARRAQRTNWGLSGTNRGEMRVREKRECMFPLADYSDREAVMWNLLGHNPYRSPFMCIRRQGWIITASCGQNTDRLLSCLYDFVPGNYACCSCGI